MAKDYDTGNIPQNKLVEVVGAPPKQQQIQQDMAEIGKNLVRLRVDYIPAVERLVELQKTMQGMTAHSLASVNMAYESIKRLVEPPSSLFAFHKSAIGTICDIAMRPSFLDSFKAAINVSTRYQDMMKDVALRHVDFLSKMSISPIVDTDYETPMYAPPVRRDPPVTNVHVNVYIERLIVHRDGRPAVIVPEAGCKELDPYFYLCYKPEEKKYGLYYYKNGSWNFEELNALPARLLYYLYDVGFHVHTYALKLDAIADALESSKGSISNRINELEKLFERLEIQDLLQKVGEDRWCLSRQLGCFEGGWL